MTFCYIIPTRPKTRNRLPHFFVISVPLIASSPKAVGMAMLVTPAATARFFVHRLHHMMLVGALGMYFSWALEVAPSAAFALAFLFAPEQRYVWALLGRSAKRA